MVAGADAPAERKGVTFEDGSAPVPGISESTAVNKLGYGSLIVLVSAVVIAGGFLYKRGQDAESVLSAGSTLTTQELEMLTSLSPKRLNDKPKGDRRSYHYATLPNGLSVLNIQDPEATQVAFSVAVDAGSLDNPKSLPGLAHFCEHMLFLGTEKFPEASGFDDFIASAGGYNNAFTADEHTVYFTEVAAHAADEGLARFGDFFRAPLFNEKFVDKEVNAIDSEHAKNVQDQDRRIFEIFTSIANPKSPMTWFKTGNLETLGTEPKKNGVDPVHELKGWFGDHYCPSRMRLVTFGAESLEKQLVRSHQNFADISTGSKTCQAPRRSWSEPQAWPQERLGRFVAIEGNKPQSELWMHFPLPDLSKDYASAPISYINYVVTYGGEQSLSRVLTDTLGLVSSLSLTGSGSSTGYDLFIVSKLTEKGNSNYEVVLDVIFQYLATLRREGVDKELYKSLADISALEWDWSEPSSPADTASGLAEQMIQIPMPELLSAGARIDNRNASLVSDLLARLRPDNMNVGVVDPKAKNNLFNGSHVKELEHYGVKYALTDYSKKHPLSLQRWSSWLSASDKKTSELRQEVNVTDELLKSLAEAKLPASSEQIAIPPKAIQGVPQNLNVEHMHASTATDDQAGVIGKLYGEGPQAVSVESNNTGGKDFLPKLWYRSGWVSESPKMSMHMDFMSPRAADSWEVKPDDSLRLSFYSSLLGEEMNPKMYDLSMTGVSYGINFGTDSISFSFSGFTPMMPELMDRVLKEFDHGVNVSDPSRYHRIHQQMKESLSTFSEMPVNYAIQDRNLLLSPGQASREEKLAALKRLTPESVASAPGDILLPKPLQLTGLAVGNIDEKDSKDSFIKVQKRAATWKGATASPAKGQEIRRFAPVVSPGKPVELRRLNQRPGDTNDAIVVSVLVGVSTVESRVIYGLLSSILHNAAYSELRTNRQLGYVVNAGISPLANVQYVSCVVQGERLRADDLEGAVEYVYSDLMPKTLKNMSKAEFESHKSSLEQQLLTPPDSFDDEFNHFWSPISEGGNCFNLADEMLGYLRSGIGRKDLIEAWNKVMLPSSGIRQKVVVKHFAKEVPERPSEKDAQASWSKQGVPDSVMEMMKKEREQALVLDKADSEARASIVASGAYFATDLHCTRAAAAPADNKKAAKDDTSKASLLEESSSRQKRRVVSGIVDHNGHPGFLQVDQP